MKAIIVLAALVVACSAAFFPAYHYPFAHHIVDVNVAAKPGVKVVETKPVIKHPTYVVPTWSLYPYLHYPYYAPIVYTSYVHPAVEVKEVKKIHDVKIVETVKDPK